MKRILVTGGAGFIGSSICIYLKVKYPEYSIVAFDNLRRLGSELNRIDLLRYNVDFIHGDVRNIEDLYIAGYFDILVDASAEPSVLSGINSDPTFVINNNLIASINCLKACLRHKAQMIFLSTSRIYPIEKIEGAIFVENKTRFTLSPDQTEKGISKEGISEEMSLEGSRSFYGATKLSSEFLIREYSEYYGLQAAITRFGMIAGPRQMGKADQGIVTYWMARHFWNKPLSYIGYGGKGKQVRDILHIDDLVSLIDYQIHNIDEFSGKIFNAGGGLQSSVSLLELTLTCKEITGNSITIGSIKQNRPADIRIYITDNNKIISSTKWKPIKRKEEIFLDIFNWIKVNEKRLKPIFNS